MRVRLVVDLDKADEKGKDQDEGNILFHLKSFVDGEAVQVEDTTAPFTSTEYEVTVVEIEKVSGNGED